MNDASKGLKKTVRGNDALFKVARRIYFIKNNLVYCLKNPSKIGKKIELSEHVTVSDLIREEGRHTFFGYYDKCPWDPSGRFILYLSVPRIKEHPTIENPGKIGYIDLKDMKTRILTETKAWNWQQGCMLQWIEKSRDPVFIYNDFRKGRYVSVLKKLQEDKEKVIPHPYYTVNDDGTQALTLNFQRLQHLRPGYGYDPGKNVLGKGYAPEYDGIFNIDLKDGSSQLILSIKEIAKGVPKTATYHWVNHLKYNPKGDRVVFLHRYLSDGKRYSRMFTMKPDGTDMYCLLDKGFVSHFTWKNNREILATAGTPEEGASDHYYVFKDKSNTRYKIAEGVLCRDGHPSFSPDGRWLLTDTYPDQGGWRELILYDLKDEDKYVVGRFYNPIIYRHDPLECDLHPRWSRDGKKICVDSVHEEYRKMLLIDVTMFLSKHS